MPQTDEGKTEGPVDIEAALRPLVEEFSAAPLVNGKSMRELMRLDRDGFRLAALTLLPSINDVRGARYLVTLLWTNDLLIQTLSDPTLPLNLAFRVAETASKVDPQLHLRLIRYLVSGMLEGQEIEETCAGRLLEVLGLIADSGGIQPFLRQLLLHPSARIRSKITLLAGRGNAGVKALSRLLKDDDARVRANAIEALWSSDDPEMMELFRGALADPSNRVRGNALIGLYMAGDTSAIAGIVELSAQSAALCRATAAWAMGKTEDPRFLPLLGRMLAESKGQLRKSVFRAIESIKKAAHARGDKPPLKVEIADLQTGESGRVQIKALVTSAESTTPPRLRGTNFLVSAAGAAITAFQFEELRSEPVALCFAIPRRIAADDPRRAHLQSGLKECLDGKPKPEQWSILRYRDAPRDSTVAPLRIFGHMADTPGGTGAPAVPPTATKPETQPVPFSANPTTLLGAIGEQGLRTDSAAGVVAACYAAITGRWPVRGARNLVLFVEDEFAPDPETLAEFIRAAIAAKVCVHALCGKAAPQIADLCRQTEGICREAATPEEIGPHLRLIYAAVKCRYFVDFPVSGGRPDSIRLQISAPVGLGEACWNAHVVAPRAEMEAA